MFKTIKNFFGKLVGSEQVIPAQPVEISTPAEVAEPVVVELTLTPPKARKPRTKKPKTVVKK